MYSLLESYKLIGKIFSKEKRTRLVVLGLTVLILFSSCKKKHNHEMEALVATNPWRQSLVIDRAYVAQVKAIQRIELRAFEKGYLTHIYVDEGKLIKKGQKMFQVMPILVQAEYEKAKAEYEASQIEFENTEMLFKENVVSKAEYATVRAKLKKSKAAMDLAKSHLDLATISAPFTGIMDKFQVRLGSFVEEGALLTTLSDISQLWVYFNVSEKDYLNFQKKKKAGGEKATVTFQMANGELFDQSGTVDTIESEFNSETGTIPFRATFPNPESLLRHGETGNILVKEEITDGLIIPQKATFEVLDSHYVYVVDESGKVSAKQITVSNEVPHLFVVSGGITEKDVVLIEGIGKINDGDTVKIKHETVENVLKGLELVAH